MADIDFVNAISTTPATQRSKGFNQRIDVDYLRRYAQTIEDWGFDATLVPYGSDSADQYALSATVLNATSRLKTVVAVRPNTAFPTVAAQGLATLDQIGSGRTIVHIISGGADAEQRRQGDYFDKQQRYERSSEFIEILRAAWTRREPFSYEGSYYRFEDFGPGYETHSGGAIPVSLGGSSDFAYAAGGRQADIFALWGEPLAETKQQIDRVYEEAAKAGRTDRIRFWVTFRPILAETDELAWEKARTLVDRLTAFYSSFARINAPEATNVGTTRLRDIAAKQEIHDGNLWTPKAFAGAGGASSLLVGSPETVAASLAKYVELGADIISLPTLGDLGEAIDTGRYVLPLVRDAVRDLELRAPLRAAV
ncbi:LLM class flavin-dependent oxidoreductase [Microbacteriaceae bacterium VKM Ac-2854]|nr:LLM class flavin-dependent oxidoreductase [Microbacteriaceae bacterium VKM Ac-2854]